MSEANDTVFESIITQNKEQWGRLLFLLTDPEPNVLWINCDTALLKKPLHDAVTAHFPHLKPYDIYIDEKTESLTKIILWEDKDKIPSSSIIHIFGMEDAVKSTEFLGNVNFQRDSLFRKTPATIIFWADFATSSTMVHKAYDWWSWLVFTFNFATPQELLTARQKGFLQELILEDTTIRLPHKDSSARIKHLEIEWDEFLKSVDGKPINYKQMKDAVAIARALAMEYSEDGKDNNAIEKLEFILKLNPELISRKDECQALNDLGVSYYNKGDFYNAKSFYEKALLGNIALYGEEHLEIARNKSNLAMVFNDMKNFQEAKKLLEDALSIIIKKYDADHPEVNTVKSNLAMVYRELGDYTQARILLETALESDLKTYDECHPNRAIKLSNLGMVYHGLGEIVKAKELFERSLNCDLKNFGSTHPNVANHYFNLAHVLLELNKIAEAKKAMLAASKIYKALYGDANVHTQSTIAFLRNLI